MSLLKFSLSSSSASILVEVSSVEPAGGLVRASRAEEEAKDAAETLEAVLHKTLPAVQALGGYLAEVGQAGLNAKLEIGLKLTDECDVVLVAPASNQATFKLTLRPAPGGTS